MLKLLCCVLLVHLTTAWFWGEEEVQTKLTNLKIEQCGGDNHTFHLPRVAMRPYPITLPSNLTLAIEAEMEHLIVGPFDVYLQIRREVFGLVPIPIPCIDGVGSCNYYNICQELNGSKKQQEIERIFGFPMKGCVVPKFKISLTVNDIALPDINNFIDFLADGDYSIEVKVRNKEKLITCLKIYAEID